MEAEERDPCPTDRIKQEITYQLVPFIDSHCNANLNIKREPPDVTEEIIEESLEVTTKQESYSSFEYLMVDECDVPEERNDYIEENGIHNTEASTFGTIPCIAAINSNRGEKTFTSSEASESTLLGISEQVAVARNHFQSHKYFCASTLSVKDDSKGSGLEEEEFCFDRIEMNVNINEKIALDKYAKGDSATTHSKNYDLIPNNKLQTAPNRFPCNICGKGFSFASNRRRHLVRVHLKQYVCGEEHKLHHVPGEGQQDKVHSSSITASRKAHKHTAKKHKPQFKASGKSSVVKILQKNKCIIKKKQQNTPFLAKVPKFNKLKGTRLRQNFPCNICNRIFSWHYLLKKHKQQEHRKKDQKVAVIGEKYPCTVCKKTYSTKYHLERHNLTGTHKQSLALSIKEKESQHSCDTCNKTFALPHHLKRHKGSITHQMNLIGKLGETSEKEYSCDICGKKFASVVFLTKHKQRHLNVPDVKEKSINRNLYPCNTCSKSFLWPSELRKHLQSATHIANTNQLKVRQTENTKTNYPCKVCDKTFSWPAGLKKHERSAGHFPPSSNLLCNICGLVFSRRSDLTRHQNRSGHHSSKFTQPKQKPKENPKTVYSCVRCGKTFPWAYQLNNHKLTHMTKKYSCNICGKLFVAEYLLKKHKVVHSKRLTNLKCEKQQPHVKVTVYTCNMCGQAFSQLSRLRKHKSTSHRLSETHSEKRDPNFSDKISNSGENKQFSLGSDLKTDMLPIATAEEKPYVKLGHTCVVCNKTYSRAWDLERHKTRVGHNALAFKLKNKGEYSCDICGRILSRLSDLNRHKAMTGHISQAQPNSTHQNQYPKSEFAYDIGGKTSLSSGIGSPNKFLDLKTSVISKKNNDKEIKVYYSCNICRKKFSRPSDLSRHKAMTGHSSQAEHLIENKDSKQQHSCGTCSKAFSRQNDLRRHVAVTGHAYEALSSEKGDLMENKHLNLKQSFISAFPNQYKLNTHKNVASYMSEAFNVVETEAYDLKSIHTCITCGKRFPWHYLLKNHRCHQAAKKFTCNLCAKSFSQEYLLKRHKLMHATFSDKVKVGQLKHKIQGTCTCFTCNRVFSRLSDLKRHINKSGHTPNKTEPELYCKVCSKAFSRLCDLRRHENTYKHQSYAPNVEKKELHSHDASRKKISAAKKVYKKTSLANQSFKANAKKQQVYHCTVCRRTYTLMRNLFKHRALTGH